ncbi:MAG TPA: UDP-N-acetylmuramoyl-tripeptide--D-alanyl-D-alanine ligase [Bacteroidia bacterium]|jgi:UDP-N-acetylmuramoyl-tripeptide--D-alanyl-D-alanine ligase|nr:UDP-N-acetylmuramoyl-tripeptide--D-alanyl-D-alanine ligase [Bacteroidia bacterium]
MTSTESLYELFKKHPSVATDTRNIRPGDIFFALKGPNFNANELAAEALKSGASYAVIDEAAYNTDPRCVLTRDALKALQHLALMHRQHLHIPFIGITGSNGKTTTKELMQAVLSRKYKTLATTGNLNNHIGVPLTILAVNSSHEMAIIEMGANHQGEIRDLSALCLPDYGLITSIGKAHLEGFGSFEGVIKAKSELYDHIRKNKGKLFVPAENDLLMGLSSGAERVTYGNKPGALVRGKVTGMDPFLTMSWQKEDSTDKHTLRSQLIGQYNADNILAAVCTGVYFGVSDDDITAAIENYAPSNNRSQLTKTKYNSLILDAYNANPSSLGAAIENFSLIKSAQKIVIIGDMLELGSESNEEHRNILKLIESKKFSKVILVGPEFGKLSTEFKAQYFANSQEALAWFSKNPVKDATILVKGSRGIKLEKLVDAL